MNRRTVNRRKRIRRNVVVRNVMVRNVIRRNLKSGFRFLFLTVAVAVAFCFANAAQTTRAEIKLELISKASLASDLKFKNTRVGGLSGMVKLPDSDSYIAVSDDRGRNQEPRFYKLDLTLTKKENEWNTSIILKDVSILHVRGEKRWKKDMVDLEGVALLPWGNLLISSEGDNNKKPRSMPTLLDVKMDGTWARNFELPLEILPERSGKQTKGIQNNRGPEGLTGTGKGTIWAAIESPLVQDKDAHSQEVRILQYEMPEAWVIKHTATFFYPIDKPSNESVAGEHGVSEIFWLQDHDLLVMERGLELTARGLNFEVKLFQVTLGEPGSLLKKKLILDLKNLNGRTTNFEALAWGPSLPDGRKTLIAVSDNNFQKDEKTEFWVFALGTEKK